jgi:hypothetical protein
MWRRESVGLYLHSTLHFHGVVLRTKKTLPLLYRISISITIRKKGTYKTELLIWLSLITFYFRQLSHDKKLCICKRIPKWLTLYQIIFPFLFFTSIWSPHKIRPFPARLTLKQKRGKKRTQYMAFRFTPSTQHCLKFSRVWHVFGRWVFGTQY